MAIGSILLPVGAATLGDGSAGAPAITHVAGTEAAAPRKSFLALNFDDTIAEHAWWTFQLPANYYREPVLKLLWSSGDTTTTRTCIWSSRIAAATPGADVPASLAVGGANVATTALAATAGMLTATSITLADSNGAVAGDLVAVLVRRDAADPSDTAVGDVSLVSVTFEYATA